MFSPLSRSGVWMIPSCDPRWRLPSWPHCPAPGKPAARNPLHWREGAGPCRNVRCGMFGVAVRPRYRWYNIIDRYTHYVKGERWDPEERWTKPSEGLIFSPLFLIHTSTKLGDVIVMFTGVWFVVSSSEATWVYKQKKPCLQANDLIHHWYIYCLEFDFLIYINVDIGLCLNSLRLLSLV